MREEFGIQAGLSLKIKKASPLQESARAKGSNHPSQSQASSRLWLGYGWITVYDSGIVSDANVKIVKDVPRASPFGAHRKLVARKKNTKN